MSQGRTGAVMAGITVGVATGTTGRGIY